MCTKNKACDVAKSIRAGDILATVMAISHKVTMTRPPLLIVAGGIVAATGASRLHCHHWQVFSLTQALQTYFLLVNKSLITGDIVPLPNQGHRTLDTYSNKKNSRKNLCQWPELVTGSLLCDELCSNHLFAYFHFFEHCFSTQKKKYNKKRRVWRSCRARYDHGRTTPWIVIFQK